METLIVTIKKKNKAAFTRQLLGSFDFLEVTKATANQKKGISARRKESLIKGFKEMKKAEAGKLKTKKAADFLKEMQHAKF